ncbi:ATP-dependent DNA helicase RecG [Rubritalea halochordaticola]|uniref:ATP-dependent DNA helicase RecG n=1 Tax=Rubritalea halochordaticola TaxID=714537 RepID=A0ABP9V177_9BACT
MNAAEPLTNVDWLAGKEIVALGSAGFLTIQHLLDHLPRRYEDRRRFDAFPAQATGKPMCLRGVVIDSAKKRFGGRKQMYEVVVESENATAFSDGTIICRWFNMPYISNMLIVGHEIVFFGKPKDVAGKLVIDHPDFEIIKDAGDDSVHVERIVPVYRNVSGIVQRRLREIIYRLVREVDAESLVPLYEVDESYPRADAYREVHFPTEMEQADAARRYFALEEFFKLQLNVAWRKKRYEEQLGRVLGKKTQLLKDFYENLPFDLTNAQKRSVKEIVNDMREAKPMHRLLQGDVGSGKTFVAMCAALLAIESGAQVALMAPTQILAEQHYLTFRKWLDPLDVRVSLRTASRREDGGMELAGGAQLVIGTHALLYENDDFTDLGLVIIDEQHKFGVEQRSRLIRQGMMPDVLVMTATPIPRTLTLTIYGDLEVSVLDERPAGRGKIVTGLRPKAKVTDVTKFLKQQLDEGRQAYLVYPLVEESESLKVGAATVEHEKWRDRLKGYEVGLLHGKLSPEEKELVMRDFRDGKIDVLVSTTVVEVGVDVPNANLMVIYHAERFGLSQLHQLRGRIGRGEHKSYCILITDGKSEDAMEKLGVMAETDDGFKIAEADLRLRGPGDVLGTQQSGLADLRFPEFLADTELVREARRLADSLLTQDPDLSDHADLREVIVEQMERSS